MLNFRLLSLQGWVHISWNFPHKNLYSIFLLALNKNLFSLIPRFRPFISTYQLLYCLPHSHSCSRQNHRCQSLIIRELKFGYCISFIITLFFVQQKKIHIIHIFTHQCRKNNNKISHFEITSKLHSPEIFMV